MLRLFLPLLFALAPAHAQNAPTPPPPGSITGAVKDVDTGAPVRDAEVGLRAAAKAITAKTDSAGRYALRDVPPGEYRVGVSTASQGQMGFGPSRTRLVSVAPGQDVANIDFGLFVFGQISGKVVDENKEPLPDISVFQVAREYRYGALRYVFAGMARTDDRGEYVLQRIQPGRPILLGAMKRVMKLDAISDAPADPKLRKLATAPTFYPDAPSPEGGQILTLRSGEERRGIDFRLRRTPNYCADGVLTGAGGPAALSFWVEERQPASGRSGSGGLYVGAPSGKTGPDGKFRICDLHPGEYRFTAIDWPAGRDALPPFFGAATLAITDQDGRDLRIGAMPKTSFRGVVAWDGAAPETPDEVKVSIDLAPMFRSYISGELRGPAPTATIPGDFSFPEVMIDDYELSVRGVPAGSYVKDITYGGNSILNKLFRPGSAMGEQGLRITIARDGGYIRANVADKDGNPVADTNVTILPDSSLPDPEYAALIVSGQTNQMGRYRSGALPPGKYYVLASAVINDNSPESVAKFRRARTKAKEVEVRPGATVQAELELVTIE